MLHIFADPSAVHGDQLTVTGNEVNHIKNVLRMKPGDEISVSSTDSADTNEYRYGIVEISDDAVVCSLRFVKEADVELPVKVTLFQGLPKADKMEWIIQKCVELGVSEIVPVKTARSVVKLEPAKQAKKVERWQAIAESAAGQSRRRIVPTVREPMSMKEATEYASGLDVRIIPYELSEDGRSTREIFESVRPGDSVAVFIGPEGGFDPAEVKMCTEKGIEPVTLGRRILRTETAGMTVLSWLIYLMEIRKA